MGMQSLRLKLRKRKYKLSLNGRTGAADRRGEGHADGPTAFSNAGSEWEFENFSPWIFTAKRPDTTQEEADEDDEKYWGPVRPRIQGLVNNNQPRPQLVPQEPEDEGSNEQGSAPRYGILSYFPRRPSSWSPTSTVAPPVPPHAWQIRRRLTTNGHNEHPSSSAASAAPSASRAPASKDLKRSASCYQEVRNAQHRVSDLDLPRSGRSSLGDGAAAPQVPVRLKRVQSELGSDQHLLQRPLASKLEPTYSRPHRWRSTSEMMRAGRAISNGFPRPLHSGLKSTLASSESHLSGSYTLLSDYHIDRSPTPPPRRTPPSLPPPPAPCLHRSPIIERRPEGGRGSPPPPPVPPHAPGVVCTRIVHPPHAALTFAPSGEPPVPQRGKQQRAQTTMDRDEWISNPSCLRVTVREAHLDGLPRGWSRPCASERNSIVGPCD